MTNFWFNDSIMPSMVCLRNLKVLNSDTTKISDKGLMILTELENFTNLICGRT